jgi:hypothetical protein
VEMKYTRKVLLYPVEICLLYEMRPNYEFQKYLEPII